MASFSVPCPKSSALALLNGSSKIQVQSALKSRICSFLDGSACGDQPLQLRFQGPTWKQSSILKVKAQLNEVAEKSSNSAPPQEKLEFPYAEKHEKEEETAVKKVASDDATISAFMNQVADLVKLVDSRDIVELQLKQSDCELIIRKKEALPQASKPVVMVQSPSTTTQTLLPQPPTPLAFAPAPTSAAPVPQLPAPSKAGKSSLPPLKCPMAGTFYRSPGPGEPPFVKVGDKVQKGQVVCIIEAMKLMNEIEADQSGKIVEILAEDGKPVSVDMPLLIVDP
ncbi:hypothetical protein Syun_023333 [Stephania yunnanensis]|uniref:Biotin carboxyl carrier protein of acetyl-CoA carboxylase n=1 Tax=Stephania yunnanensis TaxID=152371 RepID=A0AAP0I270_9MAGN